MLYPHFWLCHFSRHNSQLCEHIISWTGLRIASWKYFHAWNWAAKRMQIIDTSNTFSCAYLTNQSFYFLLLPVPSSSSSTLLLNYNASHVNVCIYAYYYNVYVCSGRKWCFTLSWIFEWDVENMKKCFVSTYFFFFWEVCLLSSVFDTLLTLFGSL